MNNDDRVVCLICGKWWQSLGHHVRHGHGISADEYRDRFGIRRSQSLASPAVRARFAASIAVTIAAGKLDGHFATNADRAADAAAKGNAAKRNLKAKGINVSPGAPHLSWDTIAAVVAAIEAGALVATAVKQARISSSAYHAGLARFTDLKSRHYAARDVSHNTEALALSYHPERFEALRSQHLQSDSIPSAKRETTVP